MTQGLAIAGLDDWNELTGPMRRGDVVVLAGRPSMGKTAVGLKVALAAAAAGHGTLFVSLEMDVAALTKRAISDLIFAYGQSASYDAVKRGAFGAFDRAALDDARARIAAWPLKIRRAHNLRMARLAMLIRHQKRAFAAEGHELRCVVVDYLGLIRGSDPRAKRYEEVGEISRAMKTLASEMDVAIVLLAQLNREVERRDDKRPMLSDLRDSGDIEQDADTVIFVFREEYYLERAEPDPQDKKRTEWEVAINQARHRLELIAAKARNGRVQKRQLFFFGSHQAVRSSDFRYGGSGYE